MQKLFTLFFFLFCPGFCFTQEPYFRHFGVEQGLPGSEAYDILQDRDGFIWIATDRGVGRYDGYSFRNFNSSDGLTDNTVFILAEDKTGNIWCATMNSKLCYFSGEKIIPFAHNSALEKQAEANRMIQSLHISSSGDVFVGHQQTGCVRIDPAGKVFYPGHAKNDSTVRQEIYLSGNDLVFGSSNLCSKLSVDRGRKLYANVDGKISEIALPVEQSSYFIRGLRKKDGTILVGTGNLIFEIAPGGTHRKHIFETNITQLNEDAGGNSWISFSGMGVRQYASGADLSGNNYTSFLLNETVTDVLQDKEGSYWMSTLANGVFYLVSPRVHCLLPVTGTGGTPVTALALKTNGQVLLGTSSGILHTCTGGKITSAIAFNNTPDNPDFIQDIYASTEGNDAWICTNQALLYMQPDGEVVNLIRSGFARTICGDDSGGCWAGGTGYVKHFMKNKGEEAPSFFLNKRVEEIFRDTATGKLLVGRSDGLYWFDRNQLQPYIIPGEKITTRVSAIRRTKNNRLVIGTLGAGIRIIEGARQIAIGKEQGLYSSIINDIDIGENGDIWAATNGGVAQVHWTADSFTVHCFSIYHGLPTNEIRRVLCRDDTIWIGTTRGAAWFIPRELEHISVAPPVYIQEILVNGIKTDFAAAGDFSSDQNQVRFSFLGISYRNGGNTTYRYRLAGLEQDWTYTSNRSVEYASLPAGNYRFEVMAKNGDGIWSASAASFAFIVGQPFWYTWWFWTMLVVLLSAAGWWIVRMRLKTIRKNAMQKGLLAEYQHQALAAQMNPHFIFNSLSSMQAFVLGDEKENALRYIDRFSFLMRKSLEHSMLKFVPLEKEIELLRAYLDIESMRFGEKLAYTIACEQSLDAVSMEVPTMLVQPFVENAVRHGLLHREEPGGEVTINFAWKDNALWCRVEDNGVGRKRSAEINRTRKKHVSFGSSITEERLCLLCDVTGQRYAIIYTDKTGEDGNSPGTIVYFTLPFRKREQHAESAAH
ncbi:MAG: putative signal transduction histidine kinase [Bacteroidetes bacterium]|nr:MAG: putative signal transduction histidine kinase [Bacteroidota bacterium]